MNKQEILKALEQNGDFCSYCRHRDNCTGVACHGGEPLFPPCSDTGYESLIDFEKYAEDYGIYLEEEKKNEL